MKLCEMNLRDPFVLPVNGVYYLYGTAAGRRTEDGMEFPVYRSYNLTDWTELTFTLVLPSGFWADSDFWAPDVFMRQGKFYMLISCIGEGRKRGTHVFSSASPAGPFLPVSPDPITPPEMQCLDATLFEEEGVLYLLYSREWLETENGEIGLCRISDDLTQRFDEGEIIFDACKSGVSAKITGKFRGKTVSGFVTDSPLLYKTEGGKYLLLWSTIGENGYNIAVAASDSLYGEYKHEKLLFDGDGGHAMLFRTFAGEQKISFHCPNESPNERPCFRSVREREDQLELL